MKFPERFSCNLDVDQSPDLCLIKWKYDYEG
jgi:hypothetical protein